jgi:hypothetical protein
MSVVPRARHARRVRHHLIHDFLSVKSWSGLLGGSGQEHHLITEGCGERELAGLCSTGSHQAMHGVPSAPAVVTQRSSYRVS